MSLDLDPLEQRILGALVEKQHTVPESYPLTVNALVAAVNQKSNRDPAMAVEEYEVEGALRALMDRGWVVQLEREGGRTRRYGHEGERQLGIDAHDMAILAELLNRGPQSPAELRTRASRMKPLAEAARCLRQTQRCRRLPLRPGRYVLSVVGEVVGSAAPAVAVISAAPAFAFSAA